MISLLASRRPPRRRFLQLAAILVLFAFADRPAASQSPSVDTPQPEAPQPAIPPGHEKLLATMLGDGATLPGNCKFSGGGVKHSVVEASYVCDGNQVLFGLAHPSRAGDGAVVTDKFSITLERGAPPPELAAALEESVRKHEGDFEWVWMGEAASSTADPSFSGWGPALAIGGLAIIALAGWMLRRREHASGG